MIVAIEDHGAWTANHGSVMFYAQRFTGMHQPGISDMRLQRNYPAGHEPVYLKLPRICYALCGAVDTFGSSKVRRDR